MGKLVRQRMHVLKYLPKQLFGFAGTEDGKQVFFHIRAFKWGEFQHKTPPIIGEEVDVEFDPSVTSNGKAPRARHVERVNEPRPACGIVEDFHEGNGYGFIRTDDGRSHYLHRTEMTDGRLPMPGMRCTFFEGFREGRNRACYVTLTPGNNS